MNCRSQEFELTLELRLVEEAALAILHTVLLHRTTGRFSYQREGTYSVGAIGCCDVDCERLGSTYVRVASASLDRSLRSAVTAFTDALRACEATAGAGVGVCGTLSLEFYQRKRSRWPFPDESAPWEVWTLRVNLVAPSSEHERLALCERAAEAVGERIVNVAAVMGRHEFTPKMPTQGELPRVFDTEHGEAQPYRHRLSLAVTTTSGGGGGGGGNVGTGSVGGPQLAHCVSTTVRKLIKDTLAL
ncbi:autophagy-related protein 101 [Lampetra fluviatilis]